MARWDWTQACCKEGRTHSPSDEGVGESQFGRLEKKPSTLPTFCRLISGCALNTQVSVTYICMLFCCSIVLTTRSSLAGLLNPIHNWLAGIEPSLLHHCIEYSNQMLSGCTTKFYPQLARWDWTQTCWRIVLTTVRTRCSATVRLNLIHEN